MKALITHVGSGQYTPSRIPPTATPGVTHVVRVLVVIIWVSAASAHESSSTSNLSVAPPGILGPDPLSPYA
jgi:hypothetical protein